MENMSQTNILEQRQLLSKSTYTILPASLRYETHKVGQSQSFDISFEHLYKTILKDKTSKIEHVFLALVFIGLGAAFFFQQGTTPLLMPLAFMGAGVGLLAYYIFGATAYLKIKVANNSYLVMRKKSPNNQEVEDFLEQLFEVRDAYLIEEYGQINTRLTYNYQLEQFKRLRRLKVWNKRQFKEQCKQLESMHRLLDLGFDIDKIAIKN